MAPKKAPTNVNFETHPSGYKHLKLEVEGPVAKIIVDIQEDKGLWEGYELKLNSYDLGVDIELADAVNRLRFEHPEVSTVVISSGQDGVFSSGANIFMLGSATHGFKVNFCKFTNETRLSIEDASAHSDQKYIAAVNGVCSGGGYELALACDEIYLIDDRKSTVALPEVPYLGVLPGTGGLTRVTDKRKVRRDLADVFCTLAEGVKGKRAKKWGLVDEVYPSSRFDEAVEQKATELAGSGNANRKGVALDALEPTIEEDSVTYRHVTLAWGAQTRTATLDIHAAKEAIDVPGDKELDANWYPLRLFRELDDALLRLRFNHPEIGLVVLRTHGDPARVLEMDKLLFAHQDTWFVRETTHFIRRTLKRMDLCAMSFFALIEEDSAFVGSFLEFAFASDRAYMLDEDNVKVALSDMNMGLLPMSNGISRLATRLLDDDAALDALKTNREPFAALDAEDAGLITLAFDDLDWEDEIRLATEERASLSPDALTGMEASLRFAGPETLETKIFGRLSAWQNWIFQRPNAVGPKGALSLYGQPESPEFDWERT
ncbi:MAG: 2,3-epoxybenzoyl-CoA dihydrolase [Myxococcota bacterium]|nr:2,3-epoxybenzoyl-CoA dihydrolase [Myxococcota bacterium]